MATGRHSGDAIKIDDDEDDSDDLDIVAINPRTATDDEDIKTPKAKGQRVAWSDDEDDTAAYKAFKRRKTDARKKASTRSTASRASSSNGKPMVGRKPNPKPKSKSISAISEQNPSSSSDDDTLLLLDETLPPHLRARRQSWNAQRLESGNSALLLPPDYSDIPFSDDENLATLHEKPSLSHVVRPPRAYEDVELRFSAGVIPAPIAQFLKPYQVDGAEWLHERFVYQKGGILGDDMGLGKTIQVIAFLTAAFGKTGDERDARRMRKVRDFGDGRWYPRVLIVCPASLMKNWEKELNRWGWWSVYFCHGEGREDALAAAAGGRLEIMLTTYNTYRLNEGAVNEIRWDCVIADECHVIKGAGTDITKAMNNVNALCRIGLSGTSIQNKYEELWTLLNWTNPGALGPLSVWKNSICVPLKLGQSHTATIPQLSKARRVAAKLVKNLLPEFFLRRTKALIADQLPKKSDRVVFCPMTETQLEAYDNFCDHELVRAIRDSGEPCSCGSGKNQGNCCYVEIEEFGKWRDAVFPCLMSLQKLSNHVALMIPAEGAQDEKLEKDIARLEIAFPERWRELYRLRDSITIMANQEFCGKWRVLKRLLRLWHDNSDKVLVFSYSVRLLRMLKLLFSTTTSYNVSYLDGSMNLSDRQQVVDEYNSDPKQFVFLISTKAGGVGLNITSANKVIVFDPNWNPAFDLQAQDRAYRIGQTRDVEVFRLISVGTVEEIVYARQIYKQQQANIGYTASVERRYFSGVQDMKDKAGEIFGLKNLFAAPRRTNVVLRDIVNKTNVAETKAGVEIAGLELERGDENEDEELGEGGEGGYGEAAAAEAVSQLARELLGADGGDAAAAAVSGSKRKRTSGGGGGTFVSAAAAKKRDPVLAILASAGVEYTHENAEVIGTSKIETRISNRAKKAGDDVGFVNQTAFVGGETQAEEDVGDGRAREVKHRYRYRPPQDVRLRQFCEMARESGFEEDVVGFALIVEGWTQKKRREFLEGFYRGRRRVEEDDGGETDG